MCACVCMSIYLSVQKKRRRVWSECEECGRRFSRMSLLKAHRQTHNAESSAASAATATEDASSPPGGNTLVLRCSQCGKRFSSANRLNSHVRTQHMEESHLTWPGQGEHRSVDAFPLVAEEEDAGILCCKPRVLKKDKTVHGRHELRFYSKIKEEVGLCVAQQAPWPQLAAQKNISKFLPNF